MPRGSYTCVTRFTDKAKLLFCPTKIFRIFFACSVWFKDAGSNVMIRNFEHMNFNIWCI